MSISGGVKFFDLSRARPDLATVAASTGNTAAPRIIDGSIYTMWQSVGSNDATTETITLTFSPAISINRLLLSNHNFKDFNIQYNTGAGFTHFAAVVGLDASMTNITETAFADTTAYYEFTPVTGITSIRIQVLKTQVVNAQKYLFRFFAFTEMGTFIGFPVVSSSGHSRNERAQRTASDKFKVQKGYRTAAFGVTFKDYSSALVHRADITLVQTLFDLETPFSLWLCGGRRGEDYFRHSIFGWGLNDLLTMNIIGLWNPVFNGNIYVGGINAAVNFVEAVP